MLTLCLPPAHILFRITTHRRRNTMRKALMTLLLLTFLASGFAQTVYAAEQKNTEDYMPSLITKTPLEGRMMAIKIIRKTIGAIQQDSEIKQAVRKKYEDDPKPL